MKDLRNPNGPTYDVEAINRRMGGAYWAVALGLAAFCVGLAGLGWAVFSLLARVTP
jgi:hypothetical protein